MRGSGGCTGEIMSSILSLIMWRRRAWYGVFTNNTVLGTSLRVTAQGKDAGFNGIPSGNLIANNVANGIVRGNTSAGFCDTLTQTNLAIPFSPPGASASSVGCDLTGALLEQRQCRIVPRLGGLGSDDGMGYHCFADR